MFKSNIVIENRPVKTSFAIYKQLFYNLFLNIITSHGAFKTILIDYQYNQWSPGNDENKLKVDIPAGGISECSRNRV